MLGILQFELAVELVLELAKSQYIRYIQIEATRALTRSGHGGSQKAHGPISAVIWAIGPATAVARIGTYRGQLLKVFGMAEARFAGV